jgi:hypothetical protein
MPQRCKHASNIDQFFGEHGAINQMVAAPIGVQSGRRFTDKGYRIELIDGETLAGFLVELGFPRR